MSLFPLIAGRSPESMAPSPTTGSARPRSARLRGRMRSRMMRPAPECAGSSVGSALPVRRNRPGGAPASTRRRTTSQTGGWRCHSSMRTVPSATSIMEESATRTSRSPRVVQLEHGVSSPGRRCRLADTPGALECQGRQIPHQRVEFLVSDAALVLHTSNHTICRASELPFAARIHSRLPNAVRSPSPRSPGVSVSPSCSRSSPFAPIDVYDGIVLPLAASPGSLSWHGVRMRFQRFRRRDTNHAMRPGLDDRASIHLEWRIA